ncbi:amino acid permease [Candidatus Woesearchaeota archaeon]|jgi:basic amino acid/polyamine antiporter, APA family|nr:amino acid permease [Candidatus Woesearchaeota archaeon]
MAELKKVLSFPVILLITINSIMGTGIFFLPALGAKNAGPASLFSWLILSFIAIYFSMVFAELCSMFPKAGGVYEFCKQAFGRFPSFIIGWVTILAGNITIAMLIVGAIQYLLPIPATIVKLSICLLFIFIFNFIAYKGMKTSAVMLVTFALITIGTLLALIVPNLLKFNPGNFDPMFVFPISTLFITIFFIAETFFGWETATFLAEETKNPEKVMPRALIGGTVIIAIICLLFVISSLGAINWKIFGASTTPLSDLASVHFGSIGNSIFTILVYLSIIGSVAGWIVSAPRLIMALTRDKLFPPQFKSIHPVYNTPYKAIIFQTILTSILVVVGFGSYQLLLVLLLPMALLLYSAVALSLIILRYKQPDTPRPFKMPFGKSGSVALIIFSLGLIGTWLFVEHGSFGILKLGLSFVAIGIPIYFLIEMYYDPHAIMIVNDLLAYFALWTENLAFPKRRQNEILTLLGDVKGKRVLEYGCGVGTVTMTLANLVGKKGKVFAVDISKKNLKIARKRFDSAGHDHVITIHDPHYDKVHHSVPSPVDSVISVGALGYTQKVRTVLKHLNRRLRKDGKIVFVDFDKFFDIIPNIDWIGDDQKVFKLFEDCGFDIQVVRKQGFAWQYVFIYGKKKRNA